MNDEKLLEIWTEFLAFRGRDTAPSLRLWIKDAEASIKMAEIFSQLWTAGDVVALSGNLAAGKTFFVHYLAKAMGLGSAVSSPTFTLVMEHRQQELTQYPDLIHMDAYRLQSAEGFVEAGLDEYFNGENLVLIEWAERMAELLPENFFLIKINRFEGREKTTALPLDSGEGELDDTEIYKSEPNNADLYVDEAPRRVEVYLPPNKDIKIFKAALAEFLEN